MERNLLRRVSRSFLRRMNEETKEAAFLNIKVGDEMLYMDSVDAFFRCARRRGWVHEPLSLLRRPAKLCSLLRPTGITGPGVW